jgi:uncharacterized protein involved in type VI secretion and phage assembly
MHNGHGHGTNIVIGTVASLDDPDKLGRVRVKLAYLGNELSDWARLVSLMAGGGRGTFFRPEVGDEVLIAFEHGDPRRPYVLGALWSSQDQPPADDGQPAQNNWRQIKSRSGHIIKLDDTNGAERIELIDKDGERRVVIDSAGQKIQVVCQTGDVEVTAPAGSVKVNAQSIELKASSTINIEAGATLSIKGATVNIN